MPTSQAAVRAALIAQYDAQYDRDMQEAQQRISALPGQPRPESKAPTSSADDKVFEQATTMLWNPLVPPALRSALFKVLAATPGVMVNPSAHDSMGRPAVEISRADPENKVIFAAYENPATGGVLELTQTDPANSGTGPANNPAGVNAAYVSYDLMLSVTRSGTIPPDPYGG